MRLGLVKWSWGIVAAWSVSGSAFAQMGEHVAKCMQNVMFPEQAQQEMDRLKAELDKAESIRVSKLPAGEIARYQEPKELTSANVRDQVHLASRAVQRFLREELSDNDATSQRERMIPFLARVKRNIEALPDSKEKQTLARVHNRIVSSALVTEREVPWAPNAADFFVCHHQEIASLFALVDNTSTVLNLVDDLDAPDLLPALAKDISRAAAEALIYVVVDRALADEPWRGGWRKKTFASRRIDPAVLASMLKFSNSLQVETLAASLDVVKPFGTNPEDAIEVLSAIEAIKDGPTQKRALGRLESVKNARFEIAKNNAATEPDGSLGLGSLYP
jgi:hypothetical protein